VGTANQFTADHYSCAPECTNATSITMAPQLVDYGSGYGTNHVAGDYRLAQGSPCINTGTNLPWMAEAVDLDGRPRIDRFSGLPDMGCYEHVPQGIIFNLR
ncbi:MAG: choice-of-anchor Q domain-containing protein, partial [Kiritimatiellia bacterium]